MNCMLFMFLLLCLCQQCCGEQNNVDGFSNTMQSVNQSCDNNVIAESDTNKMVDAPEQIRIYGYPVETHTIQTDDGYILTLHRIPHGRSSSEVRVRAPVLVIHGLFASADVAVIGGPDNAMGLVLADAGFDVWLGNARGNYYSRKHATLSPTNPSFWNFTWHEMGNSDTPAMIDYILEKTNQKQLFFVGHSMGSTVYFALMATQPEYNEKIKLMIALAPAVYTKRQSNVFGEIVYFGRSIIDGYLRSGHLEFLPRIRSNAQFGQIICQDGQRTQGICSGFYNSLFGNKISKQLNTTMLAKFMAHYPAGTSTATFDHYIETFKSGNFQWYDKSRSLKTMPKYDLSQVSSPVAIYYSVNDAIIHPAGIVRLVKELPNTVGVFKVSDRTFNHADFSTGREVKKLVYDNMINVMKKYL